MEVAKISHSDRGQIINLPRKYHFPGDKVSIESLGNKLIISPILGSWDDFADSLEQFSDDFMAEERNQPYEQIRESAFE